MRTRREFLSSLFAGAVLGTALALGVRVPARKVVQVFEPWVAGWPTLGGFRRDAPLSTFRGIPLVMDRNVPKGEYWMIDASALDAPHWGGRQERPYRPIILKGGADA